VGLALKDVMVKSSLTPDHLEVCNNMCVNKYLCMYHIYTYMYTCTYTYISYIFNFCMHVYIFSIYIYIFYIYTSYIYIDIYRYIIHLYPMYIYYIYMCRTSWGTSCGYWARKLWWRWRPVHLFF
jgi:hypothetical protein